MIPEGLVIAVSSVADGSMSAGCPANRARFLQGRGLDPVRLVTCAQVHGTAIRDVSEPGHHPETDGLRTSERGLPLMILGADCPLISVYDADIPVVTVAHAGWRGLAGGILAKIDTLAGMRAFISPHAGPCCYEVGPEVAARFPDEAIRGGTHLDLQRAAELSLGLPLTSLGPCTICHDTHSSHRRDGTADRHALVAALR